MLEINLYYLNLIGGLTLRPREVVRGEGGGAAGAAAAALAAPTTRRPLYIFLGFFFEVVFFASLG
jgi:hypothetical protein